MDMNEYQYQAGKTAVYPRRRPDGLVYTALGLAGEAGEIANKVKKIIRDDNGIITTERESELRAELGDVLWYAAMMASELGTSLGEVGRSNLNKLAARKASGTLHGAGDNR